MSAHLEQHKSHVELSRSFLDDGQFGSDPVGRKNALLVEVPERLRAPASTGKDEIVERLARRDGGLPGGRSLSRSFGMESTTNGYRIPGLAEFARMKDQLFRSHNAESRMEHPAFAKHLQRLVAGVRFELTTFGL